MKVKMVTRHTIATGKLEEGLIYDLPQEIAQELIKHGLAIAVIEKPKPEPGFAAVNLVPRSKKGRFTPRGKLSV